MYRSLVIIIVANTTKVQDVVNVATIGETGKAYKVLVNKCLVKRPIARPRSKWNDNFKMNLA